MINIPEWYQALFKVFDSVVSSISHSRLCELLKTEQGAIILSNQEIAQKIAIHFKSMEGMHKEVSGVLSQDLLLFQNLQIISHNSIKYFYPQLQPQNLREGSTFVILEKCGHLYFLDGMSTYDGPLYCETCENQNDAFLGNPIKSKLIAENTFFRTVGHKEPFYPTDIKIHKRKLQTNLNYLIKDKRKTAYEMNLKLLKHDKLSQKMSEKHSILYDEVMRIE